VLLPLAAAQLKLIFKEKGEVDYIEVASAALMAFGDLDAPSDLALKLDYRLSHLLIDEFQDTSLSQYRLTQCLITGFEPSDGRTLFIVGDPMQSIYRFRNAQVGLFLRTKREGLSHLLLKPLTLKANFRSSFPIVDWVNQVFSSIFPKFEDVSSGAVRYRSSVAQTNHEQTVCEQSDCISFYPFVEGDPEKESTCIAALVSSLLERSKDETVAVLVRARYHLVDIILAFRQANLSFQAVEIDKLNTRAVISDLVCLTQAILHLADRIAWLSVLRAPFCGLCLSDLHVIAGQNKKQTIWERLHDIDVFNALSEHGKKSVSLLRAVLDQAMKARGQKRLHRLIREAWLLLKGPSCVTQKSDLVDVNVFFELLRELDTGGDLLDFEVLQEKVDQLFANTDQEANPRLQVMTIHKAKGLEFDHVILPALERYSPKSDSELLMWMERPRTHEKSDLILAPIASKTTQEEDPVYRYCKDQDKLKERYEALRLLYVAVTRAKKQLYLLGTTAYGKEGRAKEPKKGSFLNMLWTFFEDRFASLQKEPEDQSFAESAVSLSVAKSSHFLSRLEHEVTFGKIAAFVEEPSFNVSDLALFDVTVNGLSWQAPVGTLVHRLLYEIGVSGIETWSQKRFLNSKAHFEKALRQLGVSHDDMRVALDRVCLAIENALTDQRGRWILERHRADGFEFEVVSKGNIGVRRYVIDRTFLDESSQRWIIDYKTSEVGAFSSIESFMSAEKEKYQSQLENYGKLISDCFKGEQVRFGLYFPLVPCFLEW